MAGNRAKKAKRTVQDNGNIQCGGPLSPPSDAAPANEGVKRPQVTRNDSPQDRGLGAFESSASAREQEKNDREEVLGEFPLT
jgi:hypothetical protein